MARSLAAGGRTRACRPTTPPSGLNHRGGRVSSTLADRLGGRRRLNRHPFAGPSLRNAPLSFALLAAGAVVVSAPFFVGPAWGPAAVLVAVVFVAAVGIGFALKVRGGLSFVVAAVATLAVCAPLSVVALWVPVAAVTTIAVVFFALRVPLRLPGQPRPVAAGLGVAAALLLLATSVVSLFDMEVGDGPYRGRPYAGSVAPLVPGDRAPFRGGHLVVYNRGTIEAPVLAYREGGRTSWAWELYAPDDPFDDDPALWSASDLVVERGVFQDRVRFTGEGSYRSERGHAYIWRFGRGRRFYLR